MVSFADAALVTTTPKQLIKNLLNTYGRWKRKQLEKQDSKWSSRRNL